MGCADDWSTTYQLDPAFKVSEPVIGNFADQRNGRRSTTISNALIDRRRRHRHRQLCAKFE